MKDVSIEPQKSRNLYGNVIPNQNDGKSNYSPHVVNSEKPVQSPNMITQNNIAESLCLPKIYRYADVMRNIPPLADPLIDGILRKGHKMVISGGSKAGKSFLLIQLCISLSEGIPWLNYKCRKSKVLYVNLELDEASCYHRIADVYQALEMEPSHADDLLIWSLRGYNVKLTQIIPELVERLKNEKPDVVVLDPIYKIMEGDENSAKDMSNFLSEMDVLGRELNASVIYCQHHSKGSQSGKKAMDRMSGSGVFARDADAVIDLTDCNVNEQTKDEYGDHPYHYLSATLREFESFSNIVTYFDYPCHKLAENATAVDKKSSPEEKIKVIRDCYDALSKQNRQVTIDQMAKSTTWSIPTVKKWCTQAGYYIKDKIIFRKEST